MRSHPTILVCFVIFFAVCSIAGAYSGREVSSEVIRAVVFEANKPKAPAETEPNIPAEPVVDSVAVTVNGIDILQSRIEAQINSRLEKMGAQLPPRYVQQYRQRLKQQVLNDMIVEMLLDEQVKQNNIVVTEEDVTNHLIKMGSEQNPPLSLEEIKALMEAQGQNFGDAKKNIRRGLRYQKLMETQWAGKVIVSPNDVKNYYSENMSQFKIGEQLRASHILIKPDTSDPNTDPNQAKAAAKAKAEQLLGQIKTGADFAESAKAHSDDPGSAAIGGDLNFFKKGQMVPAFEKAALALKVGEISDVVETRFGYHIIKVTDRKEAYTAPLEQVEDKISLRLAQTRQSQFIRNYIESLRAQADIVYPPGKEPTAAKPAAPKSPDTTPKETEQGDKEKSNIKMQKSK